MQPLNLHPDGQARLSDWFRRDPDLSDVALVEELLHAVAWKHPYWEQWYTRTDPTTRDRMVWVRGLRGPRGKVQFDATGVLPKPQVRAGSG